MAEAEQPVCTCAWDETGDVNSSRKKTVKASSPCQGQIYLGLEEFINEQVKPIHVSLFGDKATSRALPYCVSNRHFRGMNKSHHVPKMLAPCPCQCLLSLGCGRESPMECKTSATCWRDCLWLACPGCSPDFRLWQDKLGHGIPRGATVQGLSPVLLNSHVQENAHRKAFLANPKALVF